MLTSTQTPISLPLREEVENWDPEQVIKFLTDNNDGLKLFLLPEHIKKVQDQYVSGQAFLNYTEQKFIQDRLPRGPASSIAGLIAKIKGEQGNSHNS